MQSRCFCDYEKKVMSAQVSVAIFFRNVRVEIIPDLLQKKRHFDYA